MLAKAMGYMRRKEQNLQIHNTIQGGGTKSGDEKQMKGIYSKVLRSLNNPAASLIRENSMQNAWTSINMSWTAISITIYIVIDTVAEISRANICKNMSPTRPPHHVTKIIDSKPISIWARDPLSQTSWSTKEAIMFFWVKKVDRLEAI